MEKKIVIKEAIEKTTLYITEDEVEIIKAIAAGKTSKEVAKERGVAYTKVDIQRHNLLKKLNCRNTAHLVAVLFRQKILS